MAEIAQATRVAGQCRETVVDEFCGTYSLEERTGHVNEIDPLAAPATYERGACSPSLCNAGI